MSKQVANHPTDAVDAALADYMRRIDAGQQVEHESFIAEYPQLAEALREFLESAQIVERMAGPPLASTVKNGVKTAETHVTGVGDSVSEKSVRPTRTIDENALPVDFGRYRIKEQLGRGAMGAVYLATDTQLDREVALKLPTFDTSGGGEMVKRFYREARAVANLHHAGICPIFDVGKIDDTLYISMAYIKGKQLSALVDIDKPLPLRAVASLVRKMALALDHAHGQGVIHRDLKPANVMIDERRQPLIMDFGLARRVDKDDQTRLTQDGMVLGTPAYMSPEQVQGQLQTGKQSDVYSLGVILYELLTGDLPYKGTIAAVIGQIMTSDPPAPSAKRPDVDANLDAICQQMMARKTEDRYAGMKAAADALTGYLKGQASGRRKPADSSNKEDARALHVTTTANKSPEAIVKPTTTTTAKAPAVAPRREGMLAQWTAPWRQLPPRTKVTATSALAGLLLVMMGVVIMLRTPYGTLRIEVNDPNVTVEIDKQTISLQNRVFQKRKESGKHSLSVLVGETPVPLDEETTVTIDGTRQKVRLIVSGVELTADEFFLKRNDKTTISIQLERVETRVPDVETVGEVAGPPIPDGPPVAAPTYNWPADAPPPAIAPFDAELAKEHQQAWAKHLGLPVEKKVDLGDGEEMSFVLIPPGEFLMGTNDGERAQLLREAEDFLAKARDEKSRYLGKVTLGSIANEGPQHRVRITKPFWLSRYETTRGQFRQFVRETGHKIEGDPAGYLKLQQDTRRVQNGGRGFVETTEHPITRVARKDALAFCRWLSDKKDSGECALPSEAQWEYACRAGTVSYWHFDHTKSERSLYAWPCGRGENEKAHPVGQLKPNSFGLYDMHGNVWEQCADWYAADFYTHSTINDPVGPPPGSRPVIRGGGWNSALFSWCRSAYRGSHPADIGASSTGIRVMASIDPKILESNRPALVPVKVPRRNSPTDAPPPAIAPFGKDQAEKTQASWARHLGVSVEKEIDIGKKSKLKMVLIPPGEFFMGSTTADRTALLNVARVANDKFQIARIPMEGPRRRVRISKPFWLGRQEISRGQFRVFADETGYKTEAEKAVESSSKNDVEKMLATWRGDTGISQSDEDPVVNVSWNDAVAYCNWLSTKHPTARFHLPTEAQWEYACRAGTESLWHCGETDAALKDFAWFHENSRAKPHPGGQKKPNGFGLYDTYGNVWEWCADWLGPDFYSKGITNDPAGPNTGMTRIARGGGCRNASNLCRSALRNFQPPGHYLNILGFRVAATVEEFDAKPASKK